MDITARASADANISEDTRSSHIGLTSSVLPEVQTPLKEENSQTGVSTRNVLSTTEHGFALRTIFGREKKAYDYIIEHDGTAFLPTIITEKLINGKKKLHPDIIAYNKLPESEKLYDREMAMNTIKLLKKLGWELRKK